MRPSLLVLLLAACEADFERMIDQPRYEVDELNPYLPGNQTMQPAPAGTVARSDVVGDPSLTTGKADGRYLRTFPLLVNDELVERGRSRFDIVCATCHGLLGDGTSEVAENMQLVPPPSLHEKRLREAPVGRLFEVVSLGYGLMPAHEDRLGVRDRWAAIAYVRVLQLSQHQRVAELPPELREEARPWLR